MIKEKTLLERFSFRKRRPPFWRRAPFLRALVVIPLLAALVLATMKIFADAQDPPGFAVLTYKNDLDRTGANTQETYLNTSTVNVARFGKRMTYPVDGRVYAQPLFVPHLMLGNIAYNVVFVATEHDSVYAFDADQTDNPTPLWHTSFINPPAVVPMSGDDVACPNIGGPDVGITGTPVIDLKSQTLYVVGVTREHGEYIARLHALDLTNGQERSHSPVRITASIPGTGTNRVKNQVVFNPQRENQRAALLLLHGVVYIAWGSHCDISPYHGWLMGYSASTLKQVSVYNTTPNGDGSGIWQSGAGLAADQEGNIYLETGEGSYTADKGGRDISNAVLKLSPQHGLHVIDSFTPFNRLCMNWINQDLGSAGPLLLPRTNELLAVGKEGRIYVLNRSHLGGYHTVSGPCDQLKRTDIDQIVQESPPQATGEGVFGAMAYWHGPKGSYVYIGGKGILAFRLNGGKLSFPASSQTPDEKDSTGNRLPVTGNPAVSSDGSRAGTGIVWIVDPGGFLRAYDATNLQHELYSSQQNAARDNLGQAIKFSVPTISHGEVFVGTVNSLVIYGAL